MLTRRNRLPKGKFLQLISLLVMLSGNASATDYEYQQPEFLYTDSTAYVTDIAVGANWVLVLDYSRQVVSIAPSDLTGPSAWVSLDLSSLGADLHQIAISGDVFYVAGDTLGSLRRITRESGAFTVDAAWTLPAMPAGLDATAILADLSVGDSGELLALVPESTTILSWDGSAGSAWSRAVDSPELSNASMLAAGAGSYFVAENGADHLLRFQAGEPPLRLGDSIEGYYSLTAAQALAFDNTSERILIGDAYHQNTLVYTPDGALLRTLADSAILPDPMHAGVGSDGAIYVYDGARAALIRWQAKPVGDSAAAIEGGDPFIAHHVDDDGTEPSGLPRNPYVPPDIIVRQNPMGLRDIDFANLPISETVLAGQANYLYVVLRNSTSVPTSGGFIGTWWTPGGPPYDFPEAWSNEGFAAGRLSASYGRNLAFIDTGELGPSANEIFGPIIWTPDEEQAGDCYGEYFVLAKYMNRYDVDEESLADVVSQVNTNNDIAMRLVEVARPDCTPEHDRYEYNDSADRSATLTERWSFQGNRCTYLATRGRRESYPEAICPNVFEDWHPPPNVASHTAEQIWRLHVPDLSLHSRDDIDYFSLVLPDLEDSAYGVNDINTKETKYRNRLATNYEPEVMPECGSVLRQAFGPSGRDNSIYVNISTELIISVRGVANAVSEEPADLRREHIRFVDVDELPVTVPQLNRFISCPRGVHELEDLRFVLENIPEDDGGFYRRQLPEAGGYEIDVSYISTARRGFPEWARGFNDGWGLRPLPCLPLQVQPGLGLNLSSGLGNFSHNLPGGGFSGSFGGCLSFPGLIRPGMILPHPRTPGLIGCIADGPGCRELSYFDLAGNERFREFTLFAGKDLFISILDALGEVVLQAKSMPISLLNANPASMQMSQDPTAYILDLSGLKEGSYFMSIEGPPSELLMMPVVDEKMQNDSPVQQGQHRQ